MSTPVKCGRHDQTRSYTSSALADSKPRSLSLVIKTRYLNWLENSTYIPKARRIFRVMRGLETRVGVCFELITTQEREPSSIRPRSLPETVGARLMGLAGPDHMIQIGPTASPAAFGA